MSVIYIPYQRVSGTPWSVGQRKKMDPEQVIAFCRSKDVKSNEGDLVKIHIFA